MDVERCQSSGRYTGGRSAMVYGEETWTTINWKVDDRPLLAITHM